MQVIGIYNSSIIYVQIFKINKSFIKIGINCVERFSYILIYIQGKVIKHKNFLTNTNLQLKLKEQNTRRSCIVYLFQIYCFLLKMIYLDSRYSCLRTDRRTKATDRYHSP